MRPAAVRRLRRVMPAAASRARPGLILLVLLVPYRLHGLQFDVAACTAVSSATLCNAAADMAAALTVRAAGMAAAGNPVPGTASTLGKRLPGMPRLAFAVRHTLGSADLPAAAGIRSTSVTAWNGEVAVGLLDGFSPLPTVGGVLSVDVLGSVSLVQFPSADGFRSRAPSSFALGARLGILRESFTLPGVSLSAMYRRTGRVTFGDIGLATRDFHVRLDRAFTWTARAVVGKRVGLFGLTGGAGWDRHSGHGIYRVPDAAGSPVQLRFRDLEADRRVLFAGASWTLLVFNISGELGWESDESGGGAPDGGLFGGLAFRLTF